MILNLTSNKDSVMTSIRKDVSDIMVYPNAPMRAAALLSNLSFTLSDLTGIPQSEISAEIQRIFTD